MNIANIKNNLFCISIDKYKKHILLILIKNLTKVLMWNIFLEKENL